MANPVGSKSWCCWPFSLCCGKNKQTKEKGEEDPLIHKRRVPTPTGTPEKNKTVQADYYAGTNSFV